MKQKLTLAVALAAGLLAFGTGTAVGGTGVGAARAVTGKFSFEDQFVVQPGDPASCSFPVSVDLQVHGSYQVSLDAQGQQISAVVHYVSSGTASANGKSVFERDAQTDIIDFVTGASANVGEIHVQVPGGGVLIHDVGLLRFDANGNLTFEAGPHQGFDGDPEAIADLCAALT